MDSELVADPLHASQREVPLPTLHRTHERAMPTDLLAEPLLRQTELTPHTTEVLAHRALKPSFHPAKADLTLPISRHTDK